MNGSIYTGSTGLLSFQKGIDVTSNNIANVNTIGYKADNVSFNDLMYQGGVGKGVTTNEVLKDFTQGNLKASDSSYDFALGGEGFFTLEDPASGNVYYSRDGQFNSDKNNYLSNSNGMIVQGITPIVTGDLITADYSNAITSTIIDTANSLYTLNTYTNDYDFIAQEMQSVLDEIDINDYNNGLVTPTTAQKTILDTYNAELTALQNATSGDNKKSINTILNDIDDIISSYSTALKNYSLDPVAGTAAQKAQSTVTYPLELNSAGEYTLEILINGVNVEQNFDTDIANTLNLFSDKINQFSGVTSSVDATTGELTINSLISGKSLVTRGAVLNDTPVTIEETINEAGSGEALVNALYTDLQASLAKIGGQTAQNKSEIIDVVAGGIPAQNDILLDLNALGMRDVALNGDIETENGYIYLTDGNSRFLVGKLEAVNFRDVSGLTPEGDNLYSQGVNQSDPTYTGNTTTVMGNYLEHSNSDLSESLVDLMVWQKAFDANSKTVMTSDELLKTALALKTT